MDFEKLYEKLDKAGFEGFESDIIGIETFTPEWDLYVRIGPSGKAREIWLKNIFTDEEAGIGSAPVAVHRKVLKTLEKQDFKELKQLWNQNSITQCTTMYRTRTYHTTKFRTAK